VESGGTTEELKIRRFFTTEGVHPYDEIEWELRDAVIQNFKTGKVAFEQRGVEVPRKWSQNSTNIAAQKYFRGSPGTPQRERSVKQMIDRVVNRYHEEGRERGYFDEAEGAIFKDELTHLLVNQKAAFNSPVWFNVGWRPKGEEQVSACQPYDALVSTPAGLIPIGRLVEDGAVGEKVYDAEGVTRIVAVKANGLKDVIRIHLKSGYRLDVTADHLVWKRDRSGWGRFVPAGDLRVDDALEWHRRESYGESEIHHLEIAEAALAGWLQSDGFVGQYTTGTNRSLTIEAMTVNDDELEWVTTALDEVLPDVHRLKSKVVTQDPKLDCRRTRLYGKPLEDFVAKWGLRARGVDMEVPEHLFTAPLPVVAAYLKSIFQAEGSVSNRETSSRIAVDMISEKLIRGMQQLLLRFGIFSRVIFKPDRRPDRKGCWSLGIQNLGDRRIFADEIGFVDKVKSSKLEASLEMLGQPARETKYAEIKRIEHLGPMEVYDIQTESGEYLSHNLRVHNCFILSVEDEMSSILNWYVEEGMIFKHGSGSGINLSTLRSSKERLRSGGTASGPVSFMRGADASAGTIKSGGATRRAAKMVVLNVDHPDIKDFIWCKALEEKKALALREAGFDMDIDGTDSHSIQYQNANNSVRVTTEFMQAVIDDQEWELKAVTTGETVETVKARELMREIAQAAWDCADPGLQYDTTINDWHTCPNTGRINASNPCSEFLHVDNSSCNLASLNLLKFLDDNGNFDIDAFKHAVEIMFLAQEISVGFAHYPTEKIRDNSHRMRQLGQGVANLGALLMALGFPYDSDEGRAVAASIQAIQTGHGYATSAKIAKRVGPFDDFEKNREPMMRVMEKHRSASYEIPDGSAPKELVDAAREEWDAAIALGESYGYRNSQAVVAAPTGCLVGGSLVPTERGLVRLESLGDPQGPKWQDLGIEVGTDQGAKDATQFFVNGAEAVVTVKTKRGYMIKGTPKHRIKVVDMETGEWMWKRFAELSPDDVVPLSMNQLVGEPQEVVLPPLPQAYWTGEHHARAPRRMTADLAEFVGYFMGDGSLHSRGIRLCIDSKDFDVVERLKILGKELFHLEGHVAEKRGYTEVAFHSVRLVEWWEACGFAKRRPKEDHAGKGWLPHIPSAVLHSNDPEVYAAFIRGLFEADGTVGRGFANWSTTSIEFSYDVQNLLLALGFPTTRKWDVTGWGRSDLAVLRILNLSYNERWLAEIGFMSDRKSAAMKSTGVRQAARQDWIPFTRELIDRLAPENDCLRRVLSGEWRKTGFVSRRMASELLARSGDFELKHLLEFFYDSIEDATLGEEELTYDLSVPDNVTYIANGFVSHNTIGLLMDCDTTGIEPDLALKKSKKLVGGGTMSIVNQTVPRALRKLGYDETQVQDIVKYIDENSHVIGAPHLRDEHISVFDTAMGERSIHYMGHIKMLAAIQPFLSGTASKTVNLPEDVTVEDIEQAYIEGWRLGLKALAVYRDNCKAAQPLSISKKEKAEVAAQPEPIRRRLPKKRRSQTIKFRVADTEGYITVGEFDDGSVGEIFLKVAKQGSTLAGIMDAFAISISMGLQYGVPLSAYVKQFVNTRFEPSGMTDDPDFRIATSILDYVFRTLALEYLEPGERHALGIRTSGERQDEIEAKLANEGNGNGYTNGGGSSGVVVLGPVAEAHAGSMPFCGTCGVQMQPAGSCFACPSCGSTSGCS
jgi:ribonucleoside-diphosphate reductase alpha chain